MRLLITTSAFPRQQGEQRDVFMLELCRRLTRDFEVFVLVPHDKGFSKREDYEGMHIIKHPQSPFNVARIAYGSGILANIKKNPWLIFVVPFYFLYQLCYLRRIVRREKVEVINAHWLIPQGLTAAVFKRFFRRKVKLVVTSHGTDLLGLSGGFSGRLQRFVMKQSDRIITVSEAMKEVAGEMGFGQKTVVRSMGIDTEQFSPAKRNPELRIKHRIDGPFLLYVGAVIEPKGIRHLMQALPAVVKACPAARLLVVGEGNLLDEMKKLSSELNVSDAVIFTGALPHNELPAYFATADVFVLPSLSEGFGLVVAEAMSSGTVTVASGLPAIHDLITSGETGFLVPSGETAALEEALIKVLKGFPEQDGMSRKARQNIVDKFSWQIVAEEYAALVKGVISPPQ